MNGSPSGGQLPRTARPRAAVLAVAGLQVAVLAAMAIGVAASSPRCEGCILSQREFALVFVAYFGAPALLISTMLALLAVDWRARRGLSTPPLGGVVLWLVGWLVASVIVGIGIGVIYLLP